MIDQLSKLVPEFEEKKVQDKQVQVKELIQVKAEDETRTKQEEVCLILQKSIHLEAKSESIHLIQVNTALGEELLLENTNSKNNVWIRDGLVKITNITTKPITTKVLDSCIFLELTN
jgi:hypothetical protein